MAITMRETISSKIKCSQHKLAIAICSAMVSAAPAMASDWNFRPNINVSEKYTSNLNLSADNEESSFITEVAPGFSLNRQGKRVQANVDYSLRAINYSSDEGDNDTRHRLTSSLKSELVEDHFYINASASISQQFLSNQSANYGDDLVNVSDSTETYSFQISPIWKQRIGEQSTLTARANFNQVYYDDSTANDSGGFNFSVNYDVAPSNTKFFWGANVNQQQSNPDGSASSKAYNFSGFLGYRPSPQLSGRFRYGYVDNDLDNTTTSRASSGDFWGLSANWKPAPRTNLDASYNSKLQTGNDYGLKLFRKINKGAISVNYTESITSARQEILQSFTGVLIYDTVTEEFRALTDPDYVPTATEQLVYGTAILPSLIDDEYISKALTANYSISRSKSTYTLGVFQRNREYQSGSLGEEQDIGINAGWSIKLNSRTQAGFNYNWSQIEPNASTADTLNSLRFNLNRTLSRKTNVSMNINYRNRSSDTASNEYDEYGVAFNLKHNF